ncbi:MAG: acylphosphatase [Methylococcales bacterium]|jgi:acylphosphatase
MIRGVKLLISGRVQGVYFRLFAQKKAKQLGINGYAKNLVDGRVEIMAQADNSSIESFIKWSNKGPITARVDEVEVSEWPIEEQFTTFEIR